MILLRVTDKLSYATRDRDNYLTGRHTTKFMIVSYSLRQEFNWSRTANSDLKVRNHLITSWISEKFYITDEFLTHVVGWLVDGRQKRRQFEMSGNMCDFNHFTCLNCDLVLNKSKTLTPFI